ncbi:MAG: site-2 protease family protein [bacterium]|nr:site-2 protease family protein [bacterium]
MSPVFQEFLLWFPAVVIALTVHEFAHAYVADRLGDPTARALGRVTLNPLSHLDLVGTVLLVTLHFGWGRPVPVDTRYLANPKRDMLLIAAAGPAINVATAVVVGIGLRLTGVPLLATETGVLLYLGLQALVLLSLLLAFFNLLPIPPLDGSKVLMGLLPRPLAEPYARHAGMLSWALMGLIAVGAMTGWHPMSRLIYPPAHWLYELLTGSYIP